MKRLLAAVFAALIAASAGSSARAAVTTDVVFIVDQTSSGSGEIGWLSSMVPLLDAHLESRGVTNNRYGLVGFGALNPNQSVNGHRFLVGTEPFGSAAQLATTAGNLVSFGFVEDGWAAIDFALASYSFRPEAAINLVLITDEGRTNNAPALTPMDLLGALTSAGAKLSAIINVQLALSDGESALGHTAMGGAYYADGLGGFAMGPAGDASASDNSISTYYDLALGSGGNAWSVQALKATNATPNSPARASFTNAFIASLTPEAPTPSVPDAGSSVLWFASSLGLLLAWRRWSRR